MARRKKKPDTSNQHLITKFPTVGRCRDCSKPVLIGLLWGMDQKYDPHPLNEWGELEAKMRGAKTFWMSHPHFCHRTTSLIRNNIVPKSGGVVREHICGAPEPKLEWLAVGKTVDDEPEECPF